MSYCQRIYTYPSLSSPLRLFFSSSAKKSFSKAIESFKSTHDSIRSLTLTSHSHPHNEAKMPPPAPFSITGAGWNNGEDKGNAPPPPPPPPPSKPPPSTQAAAPTSNVSSPLSSVPSSPPSPSNPLAPGDLIYPGSSSPTNLSSSLPRFNPPPVLLLQPSPSPTSPLQTSLFRPPPSPSQTQTTTAMTRTLNSRTWT